MDSPSTGLALSRGDGYGPTLEMNREQVEEVNWYTMFFAHRFVFSNLQSRDIENALNKSKEGDSDRAAFFK